MYLLGSCNHFLFLNHTNSIDQILCTEFDAYNLSPYSIEVEFCDCYNPYPVGLPLPHLLNTQILQPTLINDCLRQGNGLYQHQVLDPIISTVSFRLRR
jgi:hypothetical protein